MAVSVAVFVRNEFHLPALNTLQSILCQVFHLQEPLHREFRLDDGICPFGVAHRRSVGLDLLKIAGLLKHLLDFATRFETVLTHKNLSLLIEAAVIVDYVDYRQVVPYSDFIVIHIVRRRNLQTARSEIHLDITILNHRDFLVNQRNEHLLAFEPVIPLIGRVDADCSIGHYGLRTGRCNHEVFVRRISIAVRDEIPQMVELAGGVPVDDLLVTDGRQSDWVPIDHPHTSIYIAFFVEVHESVDDGLAQIRVHGELGPVPVAGST